MIRMQQGTGMDCTHHMKVSATIIIYIYHNNMPSSFTAESEVPANLSLQDWIAACTKKPSVVGKGDTPSGGGCILAYAPGRLRYYLCYDRYYNYLTLC